MSTMIQGHRAQLAAGVLVHNVSVSNNMGMNWNDVVVELKVDPNAIGAVGNLMQGLQDLVQGKVPFASQLTTMTSSIIPTGTIPASSPWIGQIELEEIEEEMERDPEDIEDPVTLLTLRDLINERMDGIDSALRLAIGE